MTYPYDGIRSTIEYYENYIDFLKKQVEELKIENEELKKKLEEKQLVKRRNPNDKLY